MCRLREVYLTFLCVSKQNLKFCKSITWQFHWIYKIYLFQIEIHPKQLSGEMNKLNDKCSFKINMFTYLIMTALLNTVVFSKISLTGDSCPEEASQFTYRASQLAGFCSMRAATEGYFETDHTLKKKFIVKFIIFY